MEIVATESCIASANAMQSDSDWNDMKARWRSLSASEIVRILEMGTDRRVSVSDIELATRILEKTRVEYPAFERHMIHHSAIKEYADTAKTMGKWIPFIRSFAPGLESMGSFEGIRIFLSEANQKARSSLVDFVASEVRHFIFEVSENRSRLRVNAFTADSREIANRFINQFLAQALCANLYNALLPFITIII